MKDLKLTFTSLIDCKQKLNDLFIGDPSAKFRLSISSWKEKRGLSMNAQQHLFYAQIAKYYGDRTALEVKNECKDKFGLPILHNSTHSSDSIEFLTSNLNYYGRCQESKMKLIQILSVTSLFNTSESKEYCEDMILYWNENGVPIKFKEK